MASFFVALWESVFQPGTTPQLIIATHVSFLALLATLGWLIHATSGNIHFYALFTIALLLWFTVIWFIQELKSVQLKDNQELGKSSEAEDSNNTDGETKNSGEETTTGAEIEKKQSNTPTQLRSRKV